MSEPFDRAELIEELDGDMEFLAETFEMFVEDSTDLLEKLTNAVSASDADSVASGAHTVKSMVGNFFAGPAHQTALELEMMGKNGNLSEASAKLDALKTELERLEQSLRDLIKSSA